MALAAEPLRAGQDPIEGILAGLQERIGPQKYNAWFRHGVRMGIE